MIRCPPSIIWLGDEELQYHLHRIFLRSLSTDLDRLHLSDQDPSYGRDTQFDSLSSAAPSEDSEENGDVQPTREAQGSSCVKTRSVPDDSITTSPEEESASKSTSIHHKVGTFKAPIRRLGSSCSSRSSQNHEHLKGLWAALPDQGKSTMDRLYGLEENYRRSPLHTWATSSKDEHSRLPTSQVSRKPPATIPEMTLNASPPRGLTLASTTRSDEAGLAHSPASTTTNVDT
ncbi:hypothetical protein N7466_008908 [Penicillium verhagenii]|uniref:uncharacterized protein n=1 Tax=Penicillium verhagenii TaxID=1562060 RepID=UPI002544FC4C|nr:uncharacterized protein N7466_008908 [Penicillium verhagenii]KAJ5924721.1 hypothetical protein N7466_008908 [Penicillium verhagenii]